MDNVRERQVICPCRNREMGSCANVEGLALGRSMSTLFLVTGGKSKYICSDSSGLC